ncbi:MAG: hypothetical protein Q7Q71_01535 [Verrucomicrobiota bacterium JB023]|nr:hypothetical protein [Verrucomicrobiota bacterium JB023]
MINKLIPTLLLGSLLGLSARTWTSADGSKTFDAELVGYDDEKKTMTLLIEGEERTFELSNFSKADRLWAKKNSAKKEEDITLPGILTEDVLTKLEDGKFVPAKIEGEPKYYLVYFSASW